MSAPPARGPSGATADRDWLEAHGTHVQYRASLEQDIAAMLDVQPGPGGRHHAFGAEGQGARHPVALLHQHGLGAAAVRRGRAPARWPPSSPPRPRAASASAAW